MSREPALSYVLGSVQAALHVLEEVVEPHPLVAHDPDLASRLSRIIQLLEDFCEAAPLPRELRGADEPRLPAPLPTENPAPWLLRGRDTLDVQEAGANLASVIGEVVLGAKIAIARHGQPVVRLVPVGPIKRFDVDAVRRYTDLLPPDDRHTAEILRETRQRDRY